MILMVTIRKREVQINCENTPKWSKWKPDDIPPKFWQSGTFISIT